MSAVIKEMVPHMRKAVADIDKDMMQLSQDLLKLQGIRRGLMELYGGDTEIPEPGWRPATATEEKPKRKGFQPMDVRGKALDTLKGGHRAENGAGDGNGEGAGNREKGAARLACLRQLAEPFTAEVFALAAGIDKKVAGISLCGYATKGYIERVAAGQYQRAKAFPAS